MVAARTVNPLSFETGGSSPSLPTKNFSGAVVKLDIVRRNDRLMFIVCVVANAHMSLLNRKYEITSVTHTEDCGFDSQPASLKLSCDDVNNLNLCTRY